MSNRTYADCVKAAERKRREYLSKKNGGVSLAVILRLCSLAAGLLTPFVFLFASFYDSCTDEEGEAPKHQAVEQFI